MKLALLLVFSVSAAIAQAGLWGHVDPQGGPRQLQPASLSAAQVQAFAHLLQRQKAGEIWECEAADLAELSKGMLFKSIPLTARHDLVLAEAPAGCARGGQGSNGAMWVVRFEGDTPVLLATPKQFSGWLFSVGPSSSHGYPDIILGWHMSASEAGLSYFRFDGRSYRNIGVAKLESDDEGKQKIVADPR